MAPVSRTLTYVFTDLVGSTALWEHGDEHIDPLIQDHLGLLRSTAAAHGGELVKTTGDGMFAVFESAKRAVAAAVTIQERLAVTPPTLDGARLAVRIGLHTGESAEHDGDYFGRAINMASRLEQVAHGGQILLSSTAAAIVADELPPGTRLRSLGEHRLAGIRAPQRILQLCVAHLPSEFPPLAVALDAQDAPPPELTSIIGRNAEIEAIEDELTRHRLITVTGPPGVGKTRLATRLATRRWRRDPDRVHFIDLTPCRRATDVVSTMVTAFGTRATEERSDLDSLVRALRSNPGLVVVDNCEQLTPQVGEVVERLLTAGPEVQVVATSRQALATPAEVVWPLSPLPTPEPGATDALDAAACRLLVERAEAAGADLALPRATHAIAEICARLDGLPLAIELAAARLDTTTPDQLLAELQGPPTSSEPRLIRSLSETIDSSYTRLDPETAALFDRLAVFAGAFAPHAVGVVCDTDPEQVHRCLAELVRASMATLSQVDGHPRFRLLEPVRQYALTHGGVDDDLRLRHARYFAEHAADAGRRYRGTEAQAAAAELAADFDDARLAFHRLVEHERWSDAARLVVGLHEFCLFSLRTELYDWARRLREHGPADLPHAPELDSISAIGAWYAGHPEAATDAARRAMANTDGRPGRTIWAHTALMNAAAFEGDFVAGAEHTVAVIAESRDTEDPFWIINGLATDAIANAIAGDRARALRRAESALRRAEALGNADCVYWACLASAVATPEHDRDARYAALERALHECRSVGSRWNEGMALIELFDLQVDDGQHEDAARTGLLLIDHLIRAGGRAQSWSMLATAARLLAALGSVESAALVGAACADRPQMPRPGQQLHDLAGHLAGAVPDGVRRRLEARARFVTEDELLERVRIDLREALDYPVTAAGSPS